MHWSETGEGAPIVLLHGAFVTHTDWPRAVVEPLANVGRVFAVDRPGHGLSMRGRGEGHAHRQAEKIASVLEDEVGGPACLVAHSFGALTALAFAELFPERTAGLVLLAPVCFPEWRAENLFLGPRSLPFIGPAMSAAANATIDPMYLEWIQYVMFAPQEAPLGWKAAYPTEQILNPGSFVVEGEDSIAVSPLSTGAYRRLERLGMPITTIQGGGDRIIIGGWHARVLAQALPNVRPRWIPGVGHMVQHAAPEVVVEEVVRMLELTETGSAHAEA